MQKTTCHGAFLLTESCGDFILSHMKPTNTIDRVARDNFLASLEGQSAADAFANLHQDARDYGWNGATRSAIAKGISRHFDAKRAAATVICGGGR